MKKNFKSEPNLNKLTQMHIIVSTAEHQAQGGESSMNESRALVPGILCLELGESVLLRCVDFPVVR